MLLQLTREMLVNGLCNPKAVCILQRLGQGCLKRLLLLSGRHRWVNMEHRVNKFLMQFPALL